MRGTHWIWVLLALGLGGLAVAWLGLRGGPEPAYSTRPAPAPDAPTDPAPSPLTDDSGPAPSAPGGASLEDPGAKSATDEETGCGHPFVPSDTGQMRRYRWTQSNQDQAAQLELRASGSSRLSTGEREVRWSVRVTFDDAAVEAAQTTLTTRCVPGGAAEGPWFGVLEVLALGVRFLDEPGRWRWPREFERGQRVEGVVHFDPRGSHAQPPDGAEGPVTLQVRRRHSVEAQESLSVPAGRFTAWRVPYEERQSFGDRGETGAGTLWLARDVGLVKSVARNEAGVIQTLELERVVEPSDP